MPEADSVILEVARELEGDALDDYVRLLAVKLLVDYSSVLEYLRDKNRDQETA